MSSKTCKSGHIFEKNSSCPVCPACSAQEIAKKYGDEFPKIGAPAFRALDGIGIKHLSDLSRCSENELLKLHGFGPRALRLIKEKMSKSGLSFRNN